MPKKPTKKEEERIHKKEEHPQDKWKHRRLFLKRDAIVDMITAAVEVYKKEAFGYLLGHKHRKKYEIADAVTFQVVKREYEYVQISERSINKLNYVLSHISDVQIIGDFHSHPDFPDHLSEWDKRAIAREGSQVAMVVLVKKTNRKKKWHFHADGSVSGSLGNRYYVKMRAYEFDKKLKRVCRLKISAPYIKKIQLLKHVKEEKHNK